MAIAAGVFHPVIASIYKKITTTADGEPSQTNKLLCQRYIRFPFQARTGWETPINHQQISAGQVVIRMRKDPKTELIDPSMEIHHDGKVYGVVSPNPIMDRDELEFLCQYQTDSVVLS